MTSKLTPEQKALVKAANLSAELHCEELQTVRKASAVQSARIRAHVARVTRTDRIADRIADRLATATALNALNETSKALLGRSPKAAPKASKGSKAAPKASKGNGETTPASVQ